MSEFDNFDVNNSYPTLLFKGRYFVYKQLLRGVRLAKPHSLDTKSGRKIDRSCKHFTSVARTAVL